MEVHPPEHPIHSVRDFFMHLFTITIGLLIALGLEGLVEAAHNRHLLHTAEINLHDEIRDNRTLLAHDEATLTTSQQDIEKNIALLQAARAHQPITGSLSSQWKWNGMQLAAWETARNTGAIALMPYDDAQSYSIIYRQQSLMDDQALLYIRDIYHSSSALEGRKLSDLQPAELDAMIASSQQAIADLRLLQDLIRGLDHLYQRSTVNP